MIDSAATLRDLIYAEWEELDPDVSDLKFCIQNYGMDSGDTLYNPNACEPQIAIDEPLINNIEIGGDRWKTEHMLSIIVYLRPTNYQPTTIVAARETFLNMIAEIDRILKDAKFTTSGIGELELSSWRFQTKKANEPIIFVAAQEIKAVCY